MKLYPKYKSINVSEAPGAGSLSGWMYKDLSIQNAKIATCSINKLTAGELNVIGTIISGGKFITAASPAARIEISVTEIAGYSDATTKQFYLQASDGKAYFGGGVCVLDSSGLKIDGERAVWYNGATLIGRIQYNSTATKFEVRSNTVGLKILADGDLNVTSNANMLLYSSSGTGVYIRAGGVTGTPTADDIQLEAGNDVRIGATAGVRIEGGDATAEAPSGTDVEIASTDDVSLEAADDIMLQPAGLIIHVTHLSDLGTSTVFLDNCNADDFVNRTPSPLFCPDAINKIKLIKTHIVDKIKKGQPRKKVTTFDRDTMPADVIVPVTQRDIDVEEKRYQKELAHEARLLSQLEQAKNLPESNEKERETKQATIDSYQRKLDRLQEKGITKGTPQPGISLVAMDGLMLSAIRELTERVEKLER